MKKGRLFAVAILVFKWVYLAIIAVSLSSVIYALFTGIVNPNK